MGRRKGIYCPTCERAYTTKFVFVLALLIGQSQQVPSQPSLVANIPGPERPAKKIAHIYFVCFSPPLSLLMIGPELHRLQIYRSEMTLPGCSPPHLGPRLASPRLRSLAQGARDVCSEDSFVSHNFLEGVYFVGIGRALWYVAFNFKLTSLRMR